MVSGLNWSLKPGKDVFRRFFRQFSAAFFKIKDPKVFFTAVPTMKSFLWIEKFPLKFIPGSIDANKDILCLTRWQISVSLYCQSTSDQQSDIRPEPE